MLHEMIHLYDHCRFNVDWSNLRHHACSEVSESDLDSLTTDSYRQYVHTADFLPVETPLIRSVRRICLAIVLTQTRSGGVI
jgi:hypothetical protein